MHHVWELNNHQLFLQYFFSNTSLAMVGLFISPLVRNPCIMSGNSTIINFSFNTSSAIPPSFTSAPSLPAGRNNCWQETFSKSCLSCSPRAKHILLWLGWADTPTTNSGSAEYLMTGYEPQQVPKLPNILAPCWTATGFILLSQSSLILSHCVVLWRNSRAPGLVGSWKVPLK